MASAFSQACNEFRHVTIFHTREDLEWCQYFMRSFGVDRLQLKIETVEVNSLTMENPPEIEVALRESHVVMFIVTSYFLDFMEREESWFPKQLSNALDAEVTSLVSAMVDTKTDDVIDVCQKRGYNCSFWHHMEIDLDGKNTQKCIEMVLDLHDNNRVMLRKRITPSPMRRTSVDRNSSPVLELVPSYFNTVGEKIAILFSEKVEGAVTVNLRGCRHDIACTNVNPFCAVFVVPENISGEFIPVTIKVNGEAMRHSKPKLTNRAANPQFTSFDLLFQTMGVSTTSELDKRLAEMFCESMSKDTTALKVFDDLLTQNYSGTVIKRQSQFPTMMHWAACNGLSETCSALLAAPGAALACEICNENGDDPIDLARSAQFDELADVLYDFTDAKHVADACDLYVTAETLTHQSAGGVYEDMSPFPKSVTTLPHNRPQLPPERPQRPHSPSSLAARTPKYEMEDPEYHSPDSGEEIYLDPVSMMETSPPRAYPGGAVGRPPPVMSPCVQLGRSQQELIDIQRCVKEGKLTIAQAEMFFKAWSSRYQTGKAVSFKDRQHALNTLKSQYEQTLQTLHDVGKGQKKSIPRTPSAEEPAISDPIMTRNPPGSTRNKGRGSNASNTSSTGSSRSSDSGRGSNISQTSVFSDDSDQYRKSTKDLYLEMIQEQNNEPPPVPPRTQNTQKGQAKRIFTKPGRPQ